MQFPASVLGPQPPPLPQDQPGPLLPSGGAASRSPWGGAAAGGRFSASGPAGKGVACGAGGLARGPGSRRTVLFAVRRAPGLMAAPGTRGAGVAFAAQKEVVLERPCWLDGGCEQARRGYLYGQLCCVGGCGWRDGGAGGGNRLQERPGRPRGPGGGAWPRRSPAPRLGAETPGEEGGVESPLPPRSLRRRGWGVGRAGRPGPRVPGSGLSAVCPREVWGGRGRGGVAVSAPPCALGFGSLRVSRLLILGAAPLAVDSCLSFQICERGQRYPSEGHEQLCRTLASWTGQEQQCWGGPAETCSNLAYGSGPRGWAGRGRVGGLLT